MSRGAFFGESGGWERPQFFLPEEKVNKIIRMNSLNIIIDNLANTFVQFWCYMAIIHLSFIIAQDLNIEEYDWYGYGETYGSEAKLRTDYRYKQVRVV